MAKVIPSPGKMKGDKVKGTGRQEKVIQHKGKRNAGIQHAETRCWEKMIGHKMPRCQETGDGKQDMREKMPGDRALGDKMLGDETMGEQNNARNKMKGEKMKEDEMKGDQTR